VWRKENHGETVLYEDDKARRKKGNHRATEITEKDRKKRKRKPQRYQRPKREEKTTTELRSSTRMIRHGGKKKGHGIAKGLPCPYA
jgi:hypothetical protein